MILENINKIFIVILIVSLFLSLPSMIAFFMRQFNPTRKILNLWRNLFSENIIKITSRVVVIILFIFLYIFQKHFEIKLVDIYVSSFDFLEIFGLVIGLFSMYGIYIGFLQFVIGDSEKTRYLGRNKLNYLTDTSIWYQITQTNIFILMLFITLLFPICFYYFQNMELLYIWQTSIIILLILYIFLTKMSFKIIYILFLIKEDKDYGLERNIGLLLSKKYYKKYNIIFKKEYNFDGLDSFFNQLDYDIKNVFDEDKALFVKNVFDEIQVKQQFSTDTETHFRKMLKFQNKLDMSNSYNMYCKFLKRKWKFISKIKDKIDYRIYCELISDDIYFIDIIMKEHNKIIFENDEVKNYSLDVDRKKDINEFLFDMIFEKFKDEQMDVLCTMVKESSKKLVTKDDDLKSYYHDLEQYKWEKIFSEYLEGNITFSLPKFNRGRVTINENYDKLDDELKNYSVSLFNFLISQYSELNEKLEEDGKLMTLVTSLDEVTLMAYLLYQLLYPNNITWNTNSIIFINLFRTIVGGKYEEEVSAVYLNAAKIVAKTHIKYRISFDILQKIYEDRNIVIDDINYFDYFNYSRISKVKIVLLQEILSNTYIKQDRLIFSDIASEEKQRQLEYICVEYLNSIYEVPEIYKFESLRSSFETLIINNPINIKDLLYRTSTNLVILIYYERILAYYSDINTVVFFIKGITYSGSNCKKNYIFMNSSILEYFVIKLLDKRYQEFFNNDCFLNSFIYSIQKEINRLDLSINKFVESIAEKFTHHNFYSISKYEIERITNELTNILMD